MRGLFKFLGDVLKPLLTIFITATGLAFAASVAAPSADAWIEARLPAWERLDPAKHQVRLWLGLEEDVPWWRFWDRD